VFLEKKLIDFKGVKTMPYKEFNGKEKYYSVVYYAKNLEDLEIYLNISKIQKHEIVFVDRVNNMVYKNEGGF
jgi:transposase-like protein